MGPAFAQVAAGFSSLAAQSRLPFQISQASHSFHPDLSYEPQAQPGFHWLWGIPLAPSLTPKCGLVTWPGPGPWWGNSLLGEIDESSS